MITTDGLEVWLTGRPHMYTCTEVAAMFQVNPTTVARWADTGKLPCMRTPGGHRRFPAAQVRALLEKHESRR
jgi:excisionase family DNA binding protein